MYKRWKFQKIKHPCDLCDEKLIWLNEQRSSELIKRSENRDVKYGKDKNPLCSTQILGELSPVLCVEKGGELVE